MSSRKTRVVRHVAMIIKESPQISPILDKSFVLKFCTKKVSFIFSIGLILYSKIATEKTWFLKITLQYKQRCI